MERKRLPEKWTEHLMSQPESGMGYQITTVTIRDGRKFDNVVIVQCALLGEIKGYDDIPFDPSDIISIEVHPYEKYWGN